MSPTFDAAVRSLLAEQGARLPDLSGITILVPHHHVRTPFLATLRARQPGQVLLPPLLATLPDLALQYPVPARPDSRRLTDMHSFLGRTGWLGDTGLWPRAQALLDLIDELDDAHLAPPGEYGEFSSRIEHATGRRLPPPTEREARLVYDLWRAFRHAGPSPRLAHAQSLEQWRITCTGPLYSLGLDGLTGQEARFLARCRAENSLIDLPITAPAPGQRTWFETALREPPEGHVRTMTAPTPDIALLAASDLEHEAGTVATRIRAWLTEGCQHIAVIALDRLAARRLRALLERDDILMQDETGWTFSTATVSHVPDRWLALVQDGFHHLDLFDFLKSPFVFSDISPDTRQTSVAALEKIAARRNVISGLERFRSLARESCPEASPLIERLAEAASTFQPTSRRSLSGWTEALFVTLDMIGATTAISSDSAGYQMLELFRRLARELADDTTPHSLARWHAWLNLQLDRATFVADDIDSPIRLTHLAAARLRDFEGVAILGADAGHLPASRADELFSDNVRIQLGLPGLKQRRETILTDLIEVLGRAERILITWQAWRGTDPNLPSPWLVRLSALHKGLHGTGLITPAPAPTEMPMPEPPLQPSPHLERVPERVSASAWQALVDCPYRYFARHGLGLGEQESVTESLEKTDYGERVHEILRRFHEQHPILGDTSPEQLAASLDEISGVAFLASERDHFLNRAWRLRWQQQAQGYLDWALARERTGWRWQASESGFERMLPLSGDRSVMLHGRLDRVDAGAEGIAVLDYKTQSRTALRNRLKIPGEQVQLPFYGLLTEAVQAELVLLDDERIDTLTLETDLRTAAADEAERLTVTLTDLANGAELPAWGAPDTCRHCEMRGLCRRS